MLDTAQEFCDPVVGSKTDAAHREDLTGDQINGGTEQDRDHRRQRDAARVA